MGHVNKMLLPVNGMSMCAHCALAAVRFLETLPDGGNLIVVTGYRHREAEKSLAPVIEAVSNSSNVNLIITRNPGYREGQFSSTKAGVLNVREGVPFFISLADMPRVTEDNYAALLPLLGNYDAVRPFANGEPGHPVLHAPSLKGRILETDNSGSVRQVLAACNVLNAQVEGESWITDVDCPEDCSL